MQCATVFIVVIVALFVPHIDAKKSYSQVEDTVSSPRKTIATTIGCRDTQQCQSLSNGSWCQPNLVCIDSFCHQVVDTPCFSRTQLCDEDNRRCVAKPCAVDADCDDGIYCNGKEKCIEFVCRITNKLPCPGHCNTTLDQCETTTTQSSSPPRLAHWRTVKEEQEAFSTTNTTTGPSPPTGAIIGPSENQIWVGYIIAAMIIVIFFVLVFLMIALVNRNYLPIPVDGAQWMY